MSLTMVNSASNKEWLKKIVLPAIRWILPVIIFVLIWQKIDFARLVDSLTRVTPGMIALGLAHAPVLIMIGAFRWWSLLKQNSNKKVSFIFVLKHYWTGLALGFFAPASLGWDAYRVYVSGRRFGEYTTNAAIIIVEKMMALVTCMSLIVILAPMLPITQAPEIERILYFAYLLLFGSAAFVIGVIFTLRNRSASILLDKIESLFLRVLEKITGKLNIGDTAKNKNISFRAMMEPMANPKVIGAIILSFAIQLVSSLKSQVFFCALDYDIPFLVNLFVTPTLYFIFLLPISFGSVGIREGVYIVLYGIFGVPVEIALLVSFFNLFGMLLNNLIGGLVIFIFGTKKEYQGTAL